VTNRSSIAFVLGIALCASAITVHGQTRSRIVDECTNSTGCLPKTAMALIVLVVDAENAGIAGAPVEIIYPDATPLPSSTIPIWRTDKNSVAVGGVTAADRYRVKINIPGYFAFESETRMADGATTKVVTVQLRVPPIH
jgi:hypothetical protein